MKNINNKILAFGVLPFTRGGRAKHGLATGLFDLNNSLAERNGYSVYLAALDQRFVKSKVDNLFVYGFPIKIMVLWSLKRPIFVIYSLMNAFIFWKRFKSEKLLKSFLKILFFSYTVNKIKPNILHFHGVIDGYLSKYVKSKAVRVLRIHGINGNDKSLDFRKFYKLERKITKEGRFNLVTFVTTDNLLYWKDNYGVFNCPMNAVPNGHNPKLFNTMRRSAASSLRNNYDFHLITIGTINENKGQVRVIHALEKLDRKVKYTIIGSGDEQYINKIREIILNTKQNIQLLDFLSQKELLEYLAIADFFILPSMREGFGKVIVESIASGVPVIIPQHLPIVKEKNLINSSNSILLADSNIESIRNALDHLQHFRDFIEVASTVKDYSWEIIAKKYIYNIELIINKI